MRTFLFVLLLISCVVGCHHTRSTKPIDSTNDSLAVEKSIEPDYSEVIAPSLLNELEKFIIDFCAVYPRSDYDIIALVFYKKKNECYVMITTTHFYDSEQLIGAIQLKDKMVAFYESDSTCFHDLIVPNAFKKEGWSEFPDEHSDQIHVDFEPWGKFFKIHNRDSLELTYSGRF